MNTALACSLKMAGFTREVVGVPECGFLATEELKWAETKHSNMLLIALFKRYQPHCYAFPWI